MWTTSPNPRVVTSAVGASAPWSSAFRGDRRPVGEDGEPRAAVERGREPVGAGLRGIVARGRHLHDDERAVAVDRDVRERAARVDPAADHARDPAAAARGAAGVRDSSPTITWPFVSGSSHTQTMASVHATKPTIMIDAPRPIASAVRPMKPGPSAARPRPTL
jgi:hypothetical protein